MRKHLIFLLLEFELRLVQEFETEVQSLQLDLELLDLKLT